MSELATFRHTAWRLLPWWARGANLYRLIYACALIFDAIGTAFLASLRLRFPGLYSEESLARLGTERKLWRGPNESADSFTERLRAWWGTARRVGSAFEILRQLQAYTLPATYELHLITNVGFRITLHADGTFATDQIAWSWDGDTSKWSRFWIVLENSALPAITLDRVVLNASAAVLQPTRSVGAETQYLNPVTSPTPDPWALRRILEDNRPPHTHCEQMILVVDSRFWSELPAGNWGDWGNRSLFALYWEATT
jgi:hypothetical protein